MSLAFDLDVSNLPSPLSGFGLLLSRSGISFEVGPIVEDLGVFKRRWNFGLVSDGPYEVMWAWGGATGGVNKAEGVTLWKLLWTKARVVSVRDYREATETHLEWPGMANAWVYRRG